MSESVITEILVKAKKLIEDYEHWTTHTLARDGKGKGCDPLSNEACSFCSLGAIVNVTQASKYVADRSSYYDEAVELLRLAMYPNNYNEFRFIGDFNDKHSHEEVLDAYDKAIAMSRV